MSEWSGRTMRVGVIGTGFGANVMAPAYERLSGCEVVDVVTPREVDAVAALCRRDDIDLVSVHSPPFLHERDVTMALEGGRHVLCDKPLSTSATTSAALLSTAEDAGVVHAMNFEFRSQPWRQSLAALAAAGTLGEVRSVLWHDSSDVWRARTSGWQVQRSAGGGWFGASASHVLDTLRWIFGPLDVRSSTVLVGDDDPDRAEDGGTVMLAAGDTLITVATSGVDATRLGSRVVVAGSSATAELTVEGRLLLHGAVWPAEVEVADSTPTLPDFVDRWLATVRDAVVAGAPVGVSFLDGVEVDRLLDVAREGDRVVHQRRFLD